MSNFPIYQKIPNIFKRSPDGKQVLYGEYSNEYLRFLADKNWIFTEKVDGTNIRICWDGYNILFYGRKDNSQIPKFLLNFLEETFLSKEEIFEEVFGTKKVVFVGEGYGNKIQSVGKYYRGDVSFILFDVIVDGVYLNYVDVSFIADRFDIDIVPIVLVGNLLDGVEFVKSKPKSQIAQDKNLVMEGIVGIPEVPLYDKLGNRIAVKIKVRDFK